MEIEFYEFMGGLMVTLFEADRLITYDYLAAELHLSKTTLSAMKRGSCRNLNQYLRVITFIMETTHLTVELSVLLLQIKKAIRIHGDLVIAIVPHQGHRKYMPQDLVRLTRWDDA